MEIMPNVLSTVPGTEEGHLINISSCSLLPGQEGNNNHSIYYKPTVKGNYIGVNCKRVSRLQLMVSSKTIST